ncbi:glycosyltransferase [Vibrio splendidus]|uniref:glycosyltransferase n=1 Tax=Vibrio splendidus TaxID=29497 RepID=UPI001FB493D7|nr:glycosyltransferase [Vibrio splendidus]UOE85837.1 glycosyltransferase [Vibrio splendidus]
MKKIWLLLPDLRMGGAEKVNLDLAYALTELGFKVEFVLCKGKENEIFHLEAKNSFKIYDLNLSHLFFMPFKLSKLIDKEKPSVIIASMWGVTAIAPYARLLSKHQPKLLLIEHSTLSIQFGMSSLLLKCYLRVSTFISYRLADEVAGVSGGVAMDMASVARLNRNTKVHTLHNPVPSCSFVDYVSSSPADWQGAKYRILAVGRLVKAKDYPTLLKAIRILNQVIDVNLVILGDGALMSELLEQCENLGISEQVNFKGFVDDPKPYFISSHLFVLSSSREGFGNVIVESLGTGTPVVSTDCNYGPSEILAGGEFGELVPVGDSQALADAMYRSLIGEHDKNKLIDRAKDFSPELVAKRYLDVVGVNYI